MHYNYFHTVQSVCSFQRGWPCSRSASYYSMSLKQPWHCGLYVTWVKRWQRAILALLSFLPLVLLCLLLSIQQLWKEGAVLGSTGRARPLRPCLPPSRKGALWWRSEAQTQWASISIWAAAGQAGCSLRGACISCYWACWTATGTFTLLRRAQLLA